MYGNIAVLAGFIFIYSAVSGRLSRSLFSGAIVFTAFGLVFGPVGLGVIAFEIEGEGLRLLAELTLALVLFIDASNANLGVLGRNIQFPSRLLLVGLPLTILLGFGVGVLLFDSLTLLEVAILATMLAPTDAALGKAVVTDESVPANIREALNVESGLNDGICVPILFIFLALVSSAGGGEESGQLLALKLVVEEIGIGLVVGLGITFLGASLLTYCGKRGWITESWRQLPVVVLAVTCFALAQFLGGSGFIAAFAGGLLFGVLAGEHKHGLLLAAEGTGDTLALTTWVVFGAVVVGQSLGAFTWDVVLYSVLSLTLIRMLPVFLALIGTGLGNSEKLFMGWFGPRGLASIVFGVIVLNEHLPGGDTITMTVVFTILLSVIAHGVSANPLVALLASKVKRSQR
ncbi:cation:proton antiporter [Aestuariirhabdus sp. LZHN29]|uniref:cation:proton antiporter n=1 Tax=Aestuariirhabdus sp. LZHN29 TaxID=3417462 RepID=UPI003CEAA203